MYVCTMYRFGPRAHRLYFYRIIFQQTMAYFLFIFCFYPHAYVMHREWCDMGRADRIQIIRWSSDAHTHTHNPHPHPHIYRYIQYKYTSHKCTYVQCVCVLNIKALNSHQKIKPRGGYCTYTKLYSCIGVRKKLKSRRVFGYRDYITGMKKKHMQFA